MKRNEIKILIGLLIIIVFIIGCAEEKEKVKAGYFIDDFEEGTGNWVFSDKEAWSTVVENGNTVLRGTGHGWARLDKEWDNYIFKFRFKIIKGNVHINYRYTDGPSLYVLGLDTESGNFYLEKEIEGRLYPNLAQERLSLDDGWHIMEIMVYDNIINIYLDEKLLVKFKDTENPILFGGVAFELLDEPSENVEFLVDDIEIRPITEEGITGREWFQSGNTQGITTLQTKLSEELEDNRIGIHFSDLWKLEPEVFPEEVLDSSHILKQGVKRARFAINNFDSDRVHWSKPENTIDPTHDDLIISLADNNITMTYVLSFWDKEYVAQGGELGIPRFKTEEEIQRYLDYVQFIVHHFKDRIEYYEIWNEPDIRDTIQWIEVEDYINLVRRTIPVIRQEYPEAKIVVGGLSYLIQSDIQEYLFTVLRSGDIMPSVDVISFHSMYGTSPQYDLHKEYYYNYPSLIQEIKDTASAHGFTGEYVADELSWMTPECIAYPYTYYSETVAAKYYARGIIINLGIDVIVSQFYAVPPKGHPMQIVHTIRNLATIMSGARASDLPIEIQSEATNIKSYSFSLTNGDKLIALWTDGVAVDEDPGVKADLIFDGFSGKEVMGIDVLNGYTQPIVINGNKIEGLIVRDYPLMLHIKK